MQTHAPGDAPPRHPCICGPLRAICTRQRPCLLALPLPAFAALPNCTRGAPCAHDARRIARRPSGRSIPAHAGSLIRTSARPGTAPPCPPVMRLANGAWPSSPRQAACRATPCPADPRQRLAPLAFSPLLPPALTPPSLRHCAPHGRPSGACGSPLATVCPPGPPAPLRVPGARPVRGQ